MSLAGTAAQALYLFAPLLVSAVLSAAVHRYDLFPRLAKPIDAGVALHGRRVLGDGKTWRGVVVAVVGSTATVLVQKHAVGASAGALAIVDYANADALLLGAAIGGGAMLGELPNSFVKRRLGIRRGETASHPALRVLFWIWDQVDLLTTTWPLLAFWIRPSVSLIVTSFVLTLAIHPLVALVGYLIGARRSMR